MNHESFKSNQESVGESEWGELEKIGKNSSGPESGGGQKVKSETPEERQANVTQAAARVKEAYRKNVAKESVSDEAEVATNKKSQPQKNPFVKKRKASVSKYDTTERSRVDKLKSNLDPFDIYEYERKQIVSRPNALVKVARLVRDRLGIRTKRSEERRDREAMHIALREYREEEEARKMAMEERERAKAFEREKRNAEYEAEKVRREEESLARDMATARKELDYQRQNRYKRQRIQEVLERDLNSRLLTVDDLETEVISENPEIQKRSVSFDDVDIPVYDLKGIPFSILSTTIDYRRFNSPGEIGTETFRTVLENPAVWAERRDEAERASGFGTRKGDARGDTISASYWNSERNIGSHVPGDLIYGFECVDGDSIISVSNGDGGTSNMAGLIETTISNPDAIEQLEGAGGTNIYNEVLLRRYTENGVPKRPDYIIVENGRITEEALRHAKHFGIPIVNIERSVYAEKAERRGEELIDSISEKDNYKDLDGKIAELLSMSKYKSVFRTLDSIGRGRDIPLQMNMPPLEERCLEISKMELKKRLDFIKGVLEEATKEIKQATEKGISASHILSQFDFFNVSINDVQNQIRSTVYGDEHDSFCSAPGNCSRINIGFRLKGSSRYVETGVYDGERVYKVDEALASGNRTKDEIENSDSGFYDTLEPVVRRYFEAFRENHRGGNN